MTFLPGPARPARLSPALWLASVLLALAGLVAMHGLASHGVEGDGMGSHAGMVDRVHGPGAIVATIGENPPNPGPELDPGKGSASNEASGAWPSPFGPAGDAMPILCVAVLAGLVALSLSGLQWMNVRPVRPASHHEWVRPRPGRDRDPPSLVQLSVHRC